MNVNKLFLISALLLTGCATTEPVIKVVTQRVEVPIAVACKEEIPPPPEYCFNNISPESDIYSFVQCLLSDRKLSHAQEIVLTAKLKSCKLSVD